MPGTLYVVATPIGNLEDITLRALRVLREVDLIAAEDTRRTAGLLAKYGIGTPTLSFHEHNTRSRLPQLIARLKSGKSIALVSDAGTPGISDPGVELVDFCVRAQVPVDPIPGASAALTAAVISGFPLVPLTIWGFPPVRPKDRNRWLAMISRTQSTLTFFESPHRVAETLRACSELFGIRPIVLARELTKIHQEALRGTAEEVVGHLRSRLKGEFTVVVGPMTDNVARVVTPSDLEIAAAFGQNASARGVTRRAAISATAKELRISSRAVYEAVERSKIGHKTNGE